MIFRIHPERGSQGKYDNTGRVEESEQGERLIEGKVRMVVKGKLLQRQ